MEVVKIVMIGITGVLLALFLKESKPEYSVYLSFAVGICILGYAVEKLSYLFESIKKIQEFLPVDEKYVLVLLKMTGATYIGQFSSSICKDAGYAAIAGQIELFVKLYLMVLSLPVLLALVETIHNFLLKEEKFDSYWQFFCSVWNLEQLLYRQGKNRENSRKKKQDRS